MILAEHFSQNGPLYYQANNIPAEEKTFEGVLPYTVYGHGSHLKSLSVHHP